MRHAPSLALRTTSRGGALWMWPCAPAVVTVAVLLLAAGPALAGKPGVWSNVTDDTGTNLTQADAAYGADGTLWVTWESTPGTDHDLVVRPVATNGTLGGKVTVQSGWAMLQNPAIVRLPSGGLQVFFAGIRAGYTGDPYNGLTYASSPTGSAWTLAPGDIDYPPDATAGSDVGAVVLPTGAAFQTWYGTPGVWVHRGYAGVAGTEFEYHKRSLTGCCGYYSNLKADTAGNVWLAWASNATDKEGVWVNRVQPATGAPQGSATRLVGSNTGDDFNMMASRVPMAARPVADGGVYVAYPCGYPFTPRIKLWRLGSGSGMTVSNTTADKDFATIAADDQGRLWVVWSEKRNGRPVIVATRSNPSATRFGRTVVAPTQSKIEFLWHLTAAARGGRLDVLAHLSGEGVKHSTWHTQMLAGLSAKASPTVVKVKRKKTVTVTVSDAGVPVKDAVVKLGGKSRKTNAKGKATFKVGPYKSTRALTFKVTKSDYSGTSAKVSVRR